MFAKKRVDRTAPSVSADGTQSFAVLMLVVVLLPTCGVYVVYSNVVARPDKVVGGDAVMWGGLHGIFGGISDTETLPDAEQQVGTEHVDISDENIETALARLLRAQRALEMAENHLNERAPSADVGQSAPSAAAIGVATNLADNPPPPKATQTGKNGRELAGNLDIPNTIGTGHAPILSTADSKRPDDPWHASVNEAPLSKPVPDAYRRTSPPPTFSGPRKLLLVCLFTGGEPSKLTPLDQVDRVEAVQTSWADTDVYWVSHMDGLNESRRIRLPDEAETGGYKGIWKKSLHLFHYLANSDLGDQYDFVFKGDDDTLVNLPQLREVLKAFDPRVPVQLGNNMYGVGCRGPAPDSQFFWENNGAKPCHGGAGYVMSRGLLDIVGPHFIDCGSQWPGSSYEDAKVAFCLMRHAASHCIGMKKNFGWDRYHNAKRDMVGKKLDVLEQTPIILGTAISFHPVPPEFQHRIYTKLNEIRNARPNELADATAKALATPHRELVAQWNCTLVNAALRPTVVQGGRDSGQQQQKWEPGSMNALCQQYPLQTPPLRNKPKERSKKAQKYPSPWPNKQPKIPVVPSFLASLSNTGSKPDAVLVVLLGGKALGDRLALLSKTLRATGSKAAIVVFAVAAVAAAAKTALMGTASPQLAEIIEIKRTPVDDFVASGRVVADFLESRHGIYNNVLLAASDVVFQVDPFAHIQLRGGLVASVTEIYPRGMKMTVPDGDASFRIMGACKKRELQLWENAKSGGKRKGLDWYYFRGPGLVDFGALIGTAAALEVVLAEMLNDVADVGQSFLPTCNGQQLLSRAIWYKAVAERVPVTIPAVGEAPVVNLANNGSLWSIAKGNVVNREGSLAVFFRSGEHCLCCSDSGGGGTDERRICPDVVRRNT